MTRAPDPLPDATLEQALCLKDGAHIYPLGQPYGWRFIRRLIYAVRSARADRRYMQKLRTEARRLRESRNDT